MPAADLPPNPAFQTADPLAAAHALRAEIFAANRRLQAFRQTRDVAQDLSRPSRALRACQHLLRGEPLPEFLRDPEPRVPRPPVPRLWVPRLSEAGVESATPTETCTEVPNSSDASISEPGHSEPIDPHLNQLPPEPTPERPADQPPSSRTPGSHRSVPRTITHPPRSRGHPLTAHHPGTPAARHRHQRRPVARTRSRARPAPALPRIRAPAAKWSTGPR